MIRSSIGFGLIIPLPARGVPVVDAFQFQSGVVRVTRPEGTHQKDICCKIVVCFVELHFDRPLKGWAVEEWEEHVDAGKVVVDERTEEIGRGEVVVGCLSRFFGDLPVLKNG